MTVKEVMAKWNAIVPFPWSNSKLRKAGLDPTSTLRTITSDIIHASDYLENPKAQQAVATLTLPGEVN